MLTNTGKNILSKYLIGQAPAYASYIAFGCGVPKALNQSQSFGDYKNKTELDFEMFRSPIISRGYINEIDQAVITNVTATNNIVTYTANNSFSSGDIITISGVNSSNFNLTNVPVVSATPTFFTVSSSATGSYISGGIATKPVSSIVFTAELPTEERYEITEIGIYSAGSNPAFNANESRVLYAFSQTENWEYHSSQNAVAIPVVSAPIGDNSGNITQTTSTFVANADNITLQNSQRTNREERPRFLNSAIFVRGDLSAIVKTGSQINVNSTDISHIHLAGISLNLDKSSPKDELRIAFSAVTKDVTATKPISAIRLIVEFASAETGSDYQYARFKTDITSPSTSTRYFVDSSRLEELEKSSGFSWGLVSVVKIYATVLSTQYVINKKKLQSNVATITTNVDHGLSQGDYVLIDNLDDTFNGKYLVKSVDVPNKSFTYDKTAGNVAETNVTDTSSIIAKLDDSFYIALDALRIENISTVSPLYGLTGYTVVKTDDGRPIVKESNTSNLVEFRMNIGVE